MERLQSRIESFLRTGEGYFDSLALELFAYQFQNNSAYQAYCRSQGMTLDAVKRWQDIPAVPVRAFKSAELAAFAVGRAAAIFESSGTTQQVPSRHYLKTLTYYEAALTTGFQKNVIPHAEFRAPFFILAPSPAEAPRSSLSWMLDVVKRKWGTAESTYFVQRGRLDEMKLAGALQKAQASANPVVLLGTTLAFLAFFDHALGSGKRYALAPGSRLMDTGGMKTQKRSVTRPDFVEQVKQVFGISADHCINEYGMCEMSSQFYGSGTSTQLEGPPWVRTLVIDPETGGEVVPGDEGLLRHFDLANVDSVMAIQTEDVGVMTVSGERCAVSDGRENSEPSTAYRIPHTAYGFNLLGRAANAEVKGCSISAEAFLK